MKNFSALLLGAFIIILSSCSKDQVIPSNQLDQETIETRSEKNDIDEFKEKIIESHQLINPYLSGLSVSELNSFIDDGGKKGSFMFNGEIVDEEIVQALTQVNSLMSDLLENEGADAVESAMTDAIFTFYKPEYEEYGPDVFTYSTPCFDQFETDMQENFDEFILCFTLTVIETIGIGPIICLTEMIISANAAESSFNNCLNATYG